MNMWYPNRNQWRVIWSLTAIITILGLIAFGTLSHERAALNSKMVTTRVGSAEQRVHP
jgi:hypothetical protein